MRSISLAMLAVLAAACSPAMDEHELAQATKALCEYQHDCLGMERDYVQCEAIALDCGPAEVKACIVGSDCSVTAECLEEACGRGSGTGLEP
jgi:hypothetical protein